MNITHENYFDKSTHKQYMSVSQYKSFDINHNGCEAKALAELKGEWEEGENKAFLIGSYVHSAFESPEAFQRYIQENYDKIYQKNGKMYADFVKADKMIETLKTDEYVMQFMEGQHEVIMTGKLFGVDWKIMIDIYNPDINSFFDIKTTKNIHEKQWNERTNKRESFIELYDYFLQFAVYAEIERQNRGSDEYLHPHIIAVSKEEVPDKALIYLGQDFIQDKLLEIEITLPHIMDVKEGRVPPKRCGKCDYCKSTAKLKDIGIVHWSEI